MVATSGKGLLPAANQTGEMMISHLRGGSFQAAQDYTKRALQVSIFVLVGITTKLFTGTAGVSPAMSAKREQAL
ncbi:MAG: hypothetical protein ACREBG_08975 [Pyrinomonadaceae bacterium]